MYCTSHNFSFSFVYVLQHILQKLQNWIRSTNLESLHKGVGLQRTNTNTASSLCSQGNQTYPLKAHTPILSLTLYPDLPAGAVRAGQQGKLFSLVHGVVCAGNHNLTPGLPGLLHFILQIQHHLVHSIYLEAWDRETCGRISNAI